MTMNRLKFNEGGQPIYLDDLETLQANSLTDVATLAKALATDNETFLLRPLQMEHKEDDSVAGTMVYTVKAGSAMIKGEIVSWEETEVSLSLATDPVYLCVKRTESDSRTFEDGQTRACATNAEAWIATSVSGVQEYYNMLELPNMVTLLRTQLSITDEPAWRDLNVIPLNGYSGTVAVQELTDAYRYKIDISSSDFTTLTGSVQLFYIKDTDYLPGSQGHVLITPTTAFVATDNGVTDFKLRCWEQTMYADVTLPFDNVTSAGDLPVKIIFELPK